MDAGAAVYRYDGDGRRMKKTVGAETTYYFYSAGGRLISEFSTTSGVTGASSTDRLLYRCSDRLGTAVLIMNASGSVIENNRTLPYGELWSAQINSTNSQKFTSYERDGESGLDYAEDRHYAPNQGRFNSPDRGSSLAHIPQSWNRYAYVINDPINHRDPNGKELLCIDTWDGERWRTSCFPNPFPPRANTGILIEEPFDLDLALLLESQQDIQEVILTVVTDPQRLATVRDRLGDVRSALRKPENAGCLGWLSSAGGNVLETEIRTSAAYIGVRRGNFFDWTSTGGWVPREDGKPQGIVNNVSSAFFGWCLSSGGKTFSSSPAPFV